VPTILFTGTPSDFMLAGKIMAW